MSIWTDPLLYRLFLIGGILVGHNRCFEVNAQEPTPSTVASSGSAGKPQVIDLDECIASASEEIRRNPESAKAFYHRALYWDEKQEFVKALRDYAETIRLSPKVASVFMHRGELWRDMGEPDRAQADFDEALRLYNIALRHDPTSVYALKDRAWALYAKGEVRKAIADLDQIIALRSSTNHFVLRGIAWKELAEFDKALADFDHVIKIDPTNPAAWACRGITRALRSDRQNAIADLTEGIRLDPVQPSTYTQRAKTFLEMGEYDKAIVDCSEAVRLCPRFAPAFRFRARAWLAKDELNRALADFDQAIRFTPNYSKVAFNSREFSPYRRPADRIHSNDDPVQLERAIVMQMAGEWEKAIADLDESIRLDPKSPQVHNNYAWLQATCRNGRFRDGTKAIEHATKACEFTEWKNDTFITTLAAAHSEAGQFAEAKKRLQQAIDMAPKEDVEIRAKMMKLFNEGQPYREELKTK